MNNHFSIIRYPNTAGLKRGPNMAVKLCQRCLEEKTHGYHFVEMVHDLNDRHLSIFVCDDCLKESKASKQLNEALRKGK